MSFTVRVQGQQGGTTNATSYATKREALTAIGRLGKLDFISKPAPKTWVVRAKNK